MVFFEAEDGILKGVENKLRNVPYMQMEGTVSNAQNSYRGLKCITLGSYRLDIEYVANWHADAWVLGSNGVYSRNVWSYFSIRFFGNNEWDFKWNKNYTLWENITQELIPGAIAGSIGNPADYGITYEFWGNYYISVKQYME